MLFDGPITEASHHFASTLLPQVIFVGDKKDKSLFVSWAAMNQFQQIAVVSIIEKGTPEEAQLDQVVAERGIVPRVHIIPPKGRGLTPTCLYKEGFKEEVIAQAIATAGGIMMSYGDVVDTISKGFLDKEQRNASQEAQRGLAKISVAAKAATNANAPTPAAASSAAHSSSVAASSSASAAAPAKPATTPAVASSSSAASASPSATPASASPFPNVKISLRLADGKTHAVYTNNLWNAATQLAKAAPRFALEMGKGDNIQRAFKQDELSNLSITEGCIVRLNLDPPGISSPTTKVSSPTPAVVSTPTPAVASPTPVPTAAAASSSGASSATADIRFTLPTGVNQQLTFSSTATLGEVREQVTKEFLSNSSEMSAYCAANNLSTTDFTLVVAYPPKKLEDDEETNAKTLRDLNLGTKFALRVVMAFIGGAGGSGSSGGESAAGGAAGGMLGRIGGWLRHPTSGQQ